MSLQLTTENTSKYPHRPTVSSPYFFSNTYSTAMQFRQFSALSITAKAIKCMPGWFSILLLPLLIFFLNVQDPCISKNGLLLLLQVWLYWNIRFELIHLALLFDDDRQKQWTTFMFFIYGSLRPAWVAKRRLNNCAKRGRFAQHEHPKNLPFSDRFLCLKLVTRLASTLY